MLMLEKHEFASERYFEKDIQIPIYFTEIPDVFPWFFLLPPGWQGSLFLPAGWGVGTSKFEVRGWILRLGFVDVF